MSVIRLKLSPPWVTYVNELMALFTNDPQIRIEYVNEELTVKLYVDNVNKAAALTTLLPTEIPYGNVVLHVAVIPANTDEMPTFTNPVSIKTLFDAAFENNPVYAFSYQVDDIFTNPIVYIVFKNRVVQFFNDNLNDIYGNVSTLYQEIASDVFNMDAVHGIYFCTDIEERVGKPLGEWP